MTAPATPQRRPVRGGRAATLVAADARNLARDPLLLLSLALPLLLGLALRWGFPWAARRIPAFDLTAYAAFATGFVVIQAPLLVGFVAGFMLLDERDEGVLQAIAVTPLGARRFLTYRLLLPALLSVPAILLAIAIGGLERPSTPAVFVAVALAAAEAPMMTLLLAAFAANKVEGLALAKAAGLAVVAPFAPLLLPSPWHWLAGVVPHYWAVAVFTLRDPPFATFAAVAAAGVVVHALWTFALLRAFRRRGAG